MNANEVHSHTLGLPGFFFAPGPGVSTYNTLVLGSFKRESMSLIAWHSCSVVVEGFATVGKTSIRALSQLISVLKTGRET